MEALTGWWDDFFWGSKVVAEVFIASLGLTILFGLIGAAAKLSKSLSSQLRSSKVISEAHDYLNSSISKGDENVYLLKSSLKEIMWEYCGVIRNEKSLIKGLEKVNQLESLLTNIDVRSESNNHNDLV